DYPWSTQPGLSASDSLVAIYGGAIRGGNRGLEYFTGTPGAPGILQHHFSAALLQAGEIRGGDGDDSCDWPGEGGPGVRLSKGSIAHAVATQPQGGLGGCAYPFCGIYCENNGPGVSVETGSVWNPLDTPIRRLASEHTLHYPGTFQ